MHAHYYAGQAKLDVIALRIGSIYGPLYYSMHDPISRLCHAAVRNVEGLSHRVYNIGSGRASSNRDIVEAVLKSAPGAKCSVLKPGRSPGTSVNPATDLSRIKTDVGYEPEHTLETGIAADLDWLRKNPQ